MRPQERPAPSITPTKAKLTGEKDGFWHQPGPQWQYSWFEAVSKISKWNTPCIRYFDPKNISIHKKQYIFLGWHNLCVGLISFTGLKLSWHSIDGWQWNVKIRFNPFTSWISLAFWYLFKERSPNFQGVWRTRGPTDRYAEVASLWGWFKYNF